MEIIMTIYLLNSFPNALMPKDGESILIEGITEKQAAMMLSVADPYSDYDDTQEQRVFDAVSVSAIGHYSTALLLSKRLNDAVGATYGFKPVGSIEIPVNRISVQPQIGDVVICALFAPPSRLAEGEQWTEEQILNCPIKWVKVEF